MSIPTTTTATMSFVAERVSDAGPRTDDVICPLAIPLSFIAGPPSVYRCIPCLWNFEVLYLIIIIDGSCSHFLREFEQLLMHRCR